MPSQDIGQHDVISLVNWINFRISMEPNKLLSLSLKRTGSTASTVCFVPDFILRFIVIEDIAVPRILISNISYILAVRHVQRTFGAFYTTKVVT
jgi:hypothetical protein